MDKKYNGWTNYETWLVNLWHDQLFEDWASEYHLQTSEDAYGLGQHLHSNFESYLVDYEQLPTSGFIAELIESALNIIDWHDIGRSYLDQAIQPEEEESK